MVSYSSNHGQISLFHDFEGLYISQEILTQETEYGHGKSQKKCKGKPIKIKEVGT